jgi:hypothetical protein
MGVFDELANDLLTGVAADLEVAESATYISIAATYDTTDGDTSETRTSTTCEGVIFYQDRKALSLYSRLAARGSVDLVEAPLPQLTALIPGVQLSGVTPKANDVIARAGVEYTVESVSVDPVGAAYIFGLRLP